MNYNSFLSELTSRVREIVSPECVVDIQPARKNNGVMLDSMIIRRPDDQVCPNIYLNQIYVDYQKGMTMDQAVECILQAYEEAAPALRLDAEQLFNSDTIRRQVVFRLVNYEKNEALLKEVPHERFLDLALIYYVMVHTEEFGAGAVMVRNAFLRHYNLTKEELHEAAGENTRRLLPVDFLRITDLLREFGEKSGVNSYTDICIEEDSASSPLYVLTNQSRQYGAYYMTDVHVLGDIARALGTDLYILPSSVHECMVVPANMWDDEKGLSCMVREINRSQVSPDEFLADTVYRFCKEDGRLDIAA